LNDSSFSEKDSVILYAFAFCALLLLSLAVPLFEGDAALYVSYLIPQVCYAGAAVIYIKGYKNECFLSVVPLKKPFLLALLFAFFTAVAIYCQNLIVGVSFDWLLEFMGFSQEIPMPDITHAGGYILCLVFLCVLPAVGEEIMFRGVFLTPLRKYGDSYAVLLSALVFALSHLNPSQFIYQFIFGVYLGYAVVKTDNILFSSFLHFLSNAFVITLPLLIPNYNALGEPTLINAGIMGILCVAGTLSVYSALHFFIRAAHSDGIKKVKTEATKEEENFFKFFKNNWRATCYNKEDKKNRLFNPAVILCAALLVLLTINTAAIKLL
jgi:membrane protease YdiL (CAAX protease family)